MLFTVTKFGVRPVVVSTTSNLSSGLHDVAVKVGNAIWMVYCSAKVYELST